MFPINLILLLNPDNSVIIYSGMIYFIHWGKIRSKGTLDLFQAATVLIIERLRTVFLLGLLGSFVRWWGTYLRQPISLRMNDLTSHAYYTCEVASDHLYFFNKLIILIICRLTSRRGQRYRRISPIPPLSSALSKCPLTNWSPTGHTASSLIQSKLRRKTCPFWMLC